MSDARAKPDLHVTCRKCGYSLRGHDEAGVCPECRWPVNDSMGVGPWAAARRADHRMTARLCLVLAGVLALAIVAVVVLEMISQTSFGTGLRDAHLPVLRRVSFGIGAPTAVIAAIIGGSSAVQGRESPE